MLSWGIQSDDYGGMMLYEFHLMFMCIFFALFEFTNAHVCLLVILSLFSIDTDFSLELEHRKCFGTEFATTVCATFYSS